MRPEPVFLGLWCLIAVGVVIRWIIGALAVRRHRRGGRRPLL